MQPRWSRPLFLVAAVYDGLLGLAFTFVAPTIFAYFGVTPPNHYGYVQFPGLLLILFATMFVQIARDPVKYRDMIPYAAAFKASYCAPVFWYKLQNNIPAMWMPFAWADLVFLVLFLMVWRSAQAPAVATDRPARADR